MHITLAIILGAVGALLIMVGVLGGGFTISSASVPKVGPVPRVVSFIVGGLLVLSAITVGILENPAVWSGPDTSVAAGSGSGSGSSSGASSSSGSGSSSGYIAPVVTEPGFNVALFKAPSLSAPYVAGAEDGLADGQVVEILCTLQGDTVSFAGNTSSL
jgi:hypothetical protein